jgi:DNA-binding MarR family transcriptional regulator
MRGRKLLAHKSLGGQSLDDQQSEMRALATEMRALTGIVAKTASRAMHERMMQSGMGVTPIQIGIMRLLSREPHTASELSKLFMLDPSTLVPVIDGLETRGLVERRKDPADRRRVPLVLTVNGEDMVDNIELMSDDDVMLNALDKLGHAKAVTLRDLLRELLQQLPEGADAMCSMTDRLARLYPATGEQPAPTVTKTP